MCNMICCVVPRRKMNPSCLACVPLHHDCTVTNLDQSDQAHHGFLPGSTTHSGCMMGNHLSLVLHATQRGLKLHWFNDCAPGREQKSVHPHPVILWDFYTSLTRQNYNLSLEGDSKWLRLFCSPRAPPALRSLIRCFICPAHSDKVNYSSAFSSFTVSNCESITHWVDELVKQHARGINQPLQTVHLASHQRVFWVQTCPAASLAQKQSRMSRYKSLASIKLVFNGSQTGLKQKRWQRREPVWKTALNDK